MSPAGQPEYTRLVRARSTMGAAELYAGKHHVLYLTREFAAESYKRFYYDEILAIVSVKTAEYTMTTAISGTMIVLSALGILASLDDLPIAIFAGIFLFAGLLALINNLVKGPTVRTVIQTGVNREEIACLRRERLCEKVLPRLRALISEAQADMVPQPEPAQDETSAPTPEPSPQDPEPTVEWETT